MARPIKGLKICDVCGLKKGTYTQRKKDSYMCDQCMSNHFHKNPKERGWHKIRER